MKGKSTLTDGTYWICPLYAFKCNIEGSDRIDLGGGVALWRIPDEVQYLIDRNYEQLALNASKVEWAIQLLYTSKAALGIELNMWSPVTETRFIPDSSFPVIALITTLRLQHKGDVAPGPLLQLEISNGKFTLRSTMDELRLSKSGTYPFWAITPYEFLETEVDAFRDFWRDFQDKKQEGKLNDLKIALNRFNSSYGEDHPDRLLDQMIALESLYLGDDKELGYKLALRAAFLLATGKRERKQIFERLKNAYVARSNIVHGRGRPSKLKELVVDTEEYLRQSIRCFISLSDQYKLKDLREKLLDQNVIETGQLLKTK